MTKGMQVRNTIGEKSPQRCVTGSWKSFDPLQIFTQSCSIWVVVKEGMQSISRNAALWFSAWMFLCLAWRKLALFDEQVYDLNGKTLFLDLDVVVIGNIDCFFSYTD